MRHLAFGFLMLVACLGVLALVLGPVFIVGGAHPSDAFWLGYGVYLAVVIVVEFSLIHWDCQR